MVQTSVVLDHNFPESIIRPLSPMLPNFISLVWIKEIDSSFPDLEDHELIYALYDHGFSVMVTNNYKMLSEPWVLAAIYRTRFTVLSIEKSGHDPLVATGVLLRDLLPSIRKIARHGQAFSLRPVTPNPEKAWILLKRHAARTGDEVGDLLSRYQAPELAAPTRVVPFERARPHPGVRRAIARRRRSGARNRSTAAASGARLPLR